jgi:hypothetical protein
MAYEGPDRRSSPDTIMLLQEIQKVALVAAQTSTDVGLLRADVAEMKRDMVSRPEVEKTISDKLTENRRWNIGTLVASISAAGAVALLFKK